LRTVDKVLTKLVTRFFIVSTNTVVLLLSPMLAPLKIV